MNIILVSVCFMYNIIYVFNEWFILFMWFCFFMYERVFKERKDWEIEFLKECFVEINVFDYCDWILK